MIAKFLSSQFSGYLAIAAVVALIGAVLFIRHSGYKACEEDVKTQQIETVEKRNEIANNRPSSDAVVKRLRNGSF